MSGDRRYTAYCGLFCLDCIPSNQTFFEAVNQLDTMLADLKFEKYAELKAESIQAFKDFNVFADMLHEIKNLQCKSPCAEGGCKPDCKIRACVIEKRYEGCWECSRYTICKYLQPLKNYHGENIEHNLEMIKKYGLDNWSAKRGKHYKWL